jgi:hypothetical protein
MVKEKKTTGGWIGKLSDEDRKVQIPVYVKKKFYKEAEKAIKEFAKQYR